MELLEKLDNLLQENMTENGFKFWKVLFEKIPNIWDRLSSSTKKYHKKEDGSIQTILEHTYEMVFACCKIMSLFDNLKSKTQESDLMILSVLLHDSFKYGINDPLYNKHTDKTHDRIIGNTVLKNKEKFLKILTESQVKKLEEMTRLHSGIWSTDVKLDSNFSIRNVSSEVLFLHILDMLSTKGCLKT